MTLVNISLFKGRERIEYDPAGSALFPSLPGRRVENLTRGLNKKMTLLGVRSLLACQRRTENLTRGLNKKMTLLGVRSLPACWDEEKRT